MGWNGQGTTMVYVVGLKHNCLLSSQLMSPRAHTCSCFWGTIVFDNETRQ